MQWSSKGDKKYSYQAKEIRSAIIKQRWMKDRKTSTFYYNLLSAKDCYQCTDEEGSNKRDTGGPDDWWDWCNQQLLLWAQSVSQSYHT